MRLIRHRHSSRRRGSPRRRSPLISSRDLVWQAQLCWVGCSSIRPRCRRRLHRPPGVTRSRRDSSSNAAYLRDHVEAAVGGGCAPGSTNRYSDAASAFPGRPPRRDREDLALAVSRAAWNADRWSPRVQRVDLEASAGNRHGRYRPPRSRAPRCRRPWRCRISTSNQMPDTFFPWA